MNLIRRFAHRAEPRPERSVTRAVALRAASANDAARTVETILATEDPVLIWDWDQGLVEEVLLMAGIVLPGSGQVVMLADHEGRDIEMIRGSLRSLRVEGAELRAVAHFADDEDSLRAWKKVRGGHLTDLSVGYEILERAAVIQPGQTAVVAGRSFTAGATYPLVITTRWRPYEGSLVPIGADQASKVRARHQNTTNRAPALKENDMDFTAWLKARGINPEALTAEQRTALQADFDKLNQRAAPPATPPASPPAGDEAARAKELADTRAKLAAAERCRELTEMARAHNIEVTAEELAGFETVEAGLRALMKRAAKSAERRDNLQPVGGIVVTRDAADKFQARAKAGMLRSCGIKVEGEFADASPLSSREVISRCALIDGHSDARDWSDTELALYANGRAFYQRSGGANKTSSMFTTLLSTTADRVLIAGFDGYDDITHEQWCTIGETNSFRSFTVAGLATALLSLVKEGRAAGELDQKDGGYSSQLGVYGGTIRLTFEAIVNDLLGEFMRSIQRLGANAKRTVEVEAFRALLNATWTYDTTSSAGIATTGNLDKVRGDFRKKKNPAGGMMNASPRFLLHDPQLAGSVDMALGISVPPGSNVVAGTRVRSIVPIESALVSDTTLLAGALATTYFLTGDPRLLDTVRISYLTGVRKPMIMEFDQGAAFAQGFKVFLPMVATAATHSDGTNTRLTGMQKATA